MVDAVGYSMVGVGVGRPVARECEGIVEGYVEFVGHHVMGISGHRLVEVAAYDGIFPVVLVYIVGHCLYLWTASLVSVYEFREQVLRVFLSVGHAGGFLFQFIVFVEVVGSK